MNKTKIEWCDYTINPIKGLCQNNCWYCYAKRMYRRFKWNPVIRIDEKEFDKLKIIKKPSRIFICSTIDLFGDWICDDWIYYVFLKIKQYSQHTFIILSKFPERMVHWKFPDNCWVGTSITGIEENQSYRHGSLSGMDNIKFISFEPLLAEPESITKYLSLDWIIIGGLTPKPVHKKEWVQSLIEQVREKQIPIFLKDNLKWHEKIQEFPINNIKE
jgi:protein gp37